MVSSRPLRAGNFFEKDLYEKVIKPRPYPIRYPEATNEYANQRQKLEEEVQKLSEMLKKYQRREGLL